LRNPVSGIQQSIVAHHFFALFKVRASALPGKKKKKNSEKFLFKNAFFGVKPCLTGFNVGSTEKRLKCSNWFYYRSDFTFYATLMSSTLNCNKTLNNDLNIKFKFLSANKHQDLKITT